jgi:hypothetical protein
MSRPIVHHSLITAASLKRDWHFEINSVEWQQSRTDMEAVVPSASRGHIVQTPTKEQPYKVVLEHENSPDTEHAVGTVREGESLIRDQTPAPAPRDRSADRPAE